VEISKKSAVLETAYMFGKARVFALFERYLEAGVTLYDEHALLRVAAADEQLDADQSGAIGLAMMMQSDTEYSASGEFSSVIGVAQ
jgi:hypothetical protein